MALDRSDALYHVALLDILPTAFLYAQTDRSFAARYWEWSKRLTLRSITPTSKHVS